MELIIELGPIGLWFDCFMKSEMILVPNIENKIPDPSITIIFVIFEDFHMCVMKAKFYGGETQIHL